MLYDDTLGAVNDACLFKIHQIFKLAIFFLPFSFFENILYSLVKYIPHAISDIWLNFVKFYMMMP